MAVAGERLRNHLRAVGDQPHRLPHADVVERRGVDTHANRRPRRARRLQHLRSRVAVHDRDLCRRHVGDRVHLPTEERVHTRGVVGEVDDHDLVEVRLSRTPVVRVAHVDALLTRREALHLVRAGADVRLRLADGGRAVTDRHDAGDVLAERVENRPVRLLQRTADGALVELLDPRRIHRLERRAAEEAELLVDQPLQRVADVGRAQRLAVVELDPVVHPDRPDVGLLVGLDLLGQTVELELELRIEDDERLPAGDDARLIGPRDDVLAVDEVLGRPARDADAERAAALGRRCLECVGRSPGYARQAAADEDRASADRCPLQELLSGEAAGLRVLVVHAGPCPPHALPPRDVAPGSGLGDCPRCRFVGQSDMMCAS